METNGARGGAPVGDHEILVAGECLVDFIPESPGPLTGVERFDRRAGGAPANVAVRLAGLGPAPLLWTRLGGDPFGDFLGTTLADYGLPERFVVRDDDARTTLVFVSRDEDDDHGDGHDPGDDDERDEDGDHGDGHDPGDDDERDEDGDHGEVNGRGFTFYREGTADTSFRPGAVPDDVLDGVSFVVFGGVCLSTEPSRTAMLDLAERARDRGCTTVFDPNARPDLWRDREFAEALEAAGDVSDVIKATPADLAAASVEGSPDELLDAVLRLGPHTAFVTLGADGAVARATADAHWGPADAEHGGFEVDVVDDTGAGDAFTAGVVRALADGESLAEAVAFAGAVAAAATTREGAVSARIDRETVRELQD